MPNKYDVIIIGAGIGGLTAGAILSRNGKKVLVLEKNPVVGGYAVCFKRKGFTFDASLHLINGCKVGDRTFTILKKCGIENKIRWLRDRYLYRAVFPNHDIRIPQCNIRDYLLVLRKNFPAETKGINRLFEEIKDIHNNIYLFSRWGKVSRKFIETTTITSSEVLDKYLEETSLKALLFQLWPYFGLPPSKLPAFNLCYSIYNYLYKGGYYLIGGSGELSRNLKDEIVYNNSRVLVNRSVERIILRDNIAKGVVVKGGEEYFADSIISNVDARYTFHNLVKDNFLSNCFVDNLDNMHPSISAFQLYLGLDINLKKIGVSDYEIFINPDYNIEKHFINSLENKIKKVPLGIILYSNLDATLAPKTKSIVVITMLSGYDFWDNLRQQDYKKTKEMFAQIMIERAGDIIPNLKKYIEVKEIASPLTMERYTGNYKGAIYGWEQNLSQSGIKRLNFITPIKNLYLAGAWTYPGGGFAGVIQSGEKIAEYILRMPNAGL